MRIFLDDTRIPPPADEDGPWVLCKDLPDALSVIFGEHKIDVISLDHDLGKATSFEDRPEQTGYQLLRFFEERIGAKVWPCDATCPPVPRFLVHSANPVGRMNMLRAIQSIDRLLGREHVNPMMNYEEGDPHTDYLTVAQINGEIIDEKDSEEV